jgi:carboxylesterase
MFMATSKFGVLIGREKFMPYGRILPTAEPYFLPGGPVGCLLIHGFTSTPRVMRPLADFLHQRGRTVLGIRLGGHATGIEDMLRARCEDWLASAEDGWYLLQGCTERVFAIGFSLGAVLSLLLAEKFPLAGVVAMAPFYEMPNKLAKRLGPLLVPMSKVVPKLKKKGGGWFVPEREKEYLAYDYNPVRPAWELSRLLECLRAALPVIHTPALIVHSRDDDYVLPYQSEWVFERLGSQDKTLVWLEGSGHIITRDGDPIKAFQPIAGFVERLST